MSSTPYHRVILASPFPGTLVVLLIFVDVIVGFVHLVFLAVFVIFVAVLVVDVVTIYTGVVFKVLVAILVSS